MHKFYRTATSVAVVVWLGLASFIQAAPLALGDVIVTDSENDAVWLVDPTGDNDPTKLTENGLLSAVGHVAIDNDGQIFIAEANATSGQFKGIVQYDPVSDTQSEFASFGSITGATPTGIAIEADGSFIVTDQFKHTLYRVSPDGSTINEITTSGSNLLASNKPWGVAIDPTGNIIVATVNNDSIISIDPTTGDQTELTSGGDIDGPRGVTVDGNGNIYIANDGGKIIQWDGSTQTVLDDLSANPGNLFDITLSLNQDELLAAGPGAGSLDGKVVIYSLNNGTTTLEPDTSFSNFAPIGIATFTTSTPIPEPGSLGLFAGFLLAGACRRPRHA